MSERVRRSVGSARAGVAVVVVCASVLATSSLGVMSLTSPVEALPASVPPPPAPVTPVRAVTTVTAQGPTIVQNQHIGVDTVWGPQGSPYLIVGQVFIESGASLTLLPGTTVKTGGPDPAYLSISGQLLSLGTPEDPVKFTSYRDDTVGGDTNGDGNASTPSRGDWGGVSISGQGSNGADEVNPVSVIDYTEFSYGGAAAAGCFNGSMLEVGMPAGRAIITNSTFRESYNAGVSTGSHSAYNGFTGVYNNTFVDSRCGVSMREGDIAGNYFGPGMDYSLFSLYPGQMDFRHNIAKSPVMSHEGDNGGVKFRFNELSTIAVYGAANQQSGDYRWNYWGSGSPLAGDSLGSAPPQILPESITRAYHPTYGPVDTGFGVLNYSVEDLAVNDAGKSLVASRTYSSDPQGAASDLGEGWRSSFSESLAQDASGALTMEASDGGQLPFGSTPQSGQSDSLGVAAGISSDTSGTAVTNSDNTTYQFDASGQLTSMVLDDPGHEVDIDRAPGSGGKVIKATGVSGRFIEFDRASGKLTATADSQNREVTYAYAGNLLSSATGVDGKTETYDYGAADRLTKVTSPTGMVKLEVGYDSQGRVEWIEQAGEGRATIVYTSADTRTITRADDVEVVQRLDAYGRLAVETIGDIATHVIYDADGREITRIQGVPDGPMRGYGPAGSAVLFNDRGDVIWDIDPVGRGTRTRFNRDHKPTSIRNVRGGVSTYTYGTQGRLTSVTDARDGTWQVEHNGRGQVTKVTDPVGREQLRTYQADGDPATQTNYYGGQSTYGTDALGRITTRTDPQGHDTEWTYTTWGAIASQTVTGGTTSTTFDDDRRAVTITDPRGGETVQDYDTSGRLASSTNAEGGVTEYGYDDMGRVTTITDPLDRVTTRVYDDQGRPIEVTDPDGATTSTEYDPAGHPIWVTDALGAVTQTVVDRSGLPLRVDYPNGGSETYTRRNAGDITRYTNPLGGNFEYTYNKLGDLTYSRSPRDAVETQTYDVLGRPLVTTDARNNVTTLTYSNAGRTTTAVDNLGAVSTTTLNTSGQVATETDGMGRSTTYTYNGAGRVLTRTLPGGRTSTTVYDDAGTPVEETDPAGRTITATLDDLGRPETKTYADGSTEEFGYDAVGNLTSHTDRRGETWTYEFDDLNRVTTETDPLNGTVEHTWDEVGNETSTTDPTGIVTTIANDPMGRPAVISNPVGAYTQITYDRMGNTSSSRSPHGGLTEWVRDNIGRTIRYALPAYQGTTEYEYDANNNVLSARLDQTTLYWVYDARNRVTEEKDRRGNTTLTGYNLADQPTSRTTPSGSTVTQTYDTTGRLGTATNDTGQATTYTWTPDDQLASLTLPRGGGYDWTYNQAGNPLTETVHTGGTGPSANPVTTFTHDPLGNLTATDYPSGRDTTATYDELGRLKTQTATPAGSSSTSTRTYDYDPSGRLTSATRTGAPSLTYTYDALGRMATSVDQVGTTTFGYDASDRLTSVTPPTGQEASTYGYNPADRLETVRGAVNLDYSFNADGTLRHRENIGPSQASSAYYSYDADNHVTAITSGKASVTATYDPDGKIATQTQTLDGLDNAEEGTTSYTYDDNNRLASATLTRDGTVIRKRGYAWDGDNNRTQSTIREGDATATTETSNATYDNAGRLTSTTSPAGTTSYTYDLDGQLTGVDAPGTTGDQTYVYDGFGELASTTTGSGTGAATNTFTRDALSRLTKWSGSAPTTQFGYTGTEDAATSLTAPAGAGTQTTQLVRDPLGQLISARTGTGSSTQIAHTATNIHGDLIAWRATNTDLITSALYDPFGLPTTTAGTGTGPGTDLPIGYESHLTLPDTGLTDLGSRAYNPATGTFTSQDTVIGDLSSPVTLNRYTYAFASPLNYTDPTGYWPDILEDLVSSAIDKGSDLIDKGKDVAQTVASTASSVASTVTSTITSAASTVASAASSTASAATRGFQAAQSWVSENKATIASVAVGVAVGAGCTAITAGAGAVLGCAALSGAASGIVSNALDPNADHSFAGYVQATAIGTGAGLLGYGLGKLAAPVAKRLAAPLLTRANAISSRASQGMKPIGIPLRDLRSAPRPETVRVYRVESPGNARLDIGPSGDVAIKGDKTLFLNFGDEARAQEFLGQRLGQGFSGTTIKSFDVPGSYVDDLRSRSVPESLARIGSVFQVDVTKTAGSFGLRKTELQKLQCAIIPGSAC